MSHLPMVASLDPVEGKLPQLLGDRLLSQESAYGEVALTIPREAIVEVLTLLRDTPELAFEQLLDICGVDYPERPERFDVVYHLLSMRHNRRIRIKLSTDDRKPVPSVVDMFPCAGWYERETFDCYGVLFEGNPDLRRILTDYGFEGHPFRKDFPLTGHVELQYSEEAGRVVYGPVRLPQDFRHFDFLSPWEGGHWQLPGDEKATG